MGTARDPVNEPIKKRKWQEQAGKLIVLVFAWSLPMSLFGMQVGVGLGVLLLAVVGVLTRGKSFTKTPLDRAVLTMLIAIAFSLVFAPYESITFRGATSFWVAASFYVIWYFLDSETLLKRSVSGIILLASLVSVFAVYQSISSNYPLGSIIHPQIDVLLKPVPDMDGRVGGVGLFHSRLTLAHMLLFPFCWAVAWLMESIGARFKFLLAIAVVCMLLGLWFTWTRAAFFIACLVALILVGSRLQRKYGKKIWVIGGAGLFVFILTLLSLSPQMNNRVLDSFAGGRDWGRLTLWQTALDVASDNPVTGCGYGNFQRVATKRIEERVHKMGKKRFSAVIAWAHSNLLTFLAEAGLVGAFAFCFLFVSYFRVAGKTLGSLHPQKKMLRGFVRGSIAAVGGFLLAGCFHDTFFDGEVVFILWFTMAASLACSRFQSFPQEVVKC